VVFERKFLKMSFLVDEVRGEAVAGEAVVVAIEDDGLAVVVVVVEVPPVEEMKTNGSVDCGREVLVVG